MSSTVEGTIDLHENRLQSSEIDRLKCFCYLLLFERPISTAKWVYQIIGRSAREGILVSPLVCIRYVYPSFMGKVNKKITNSLA